MTYEIIKWMLDAMNYAPLQFFTPDRTLYTCECPVTPEKCVFLCQIGHAGSGSGMYLRTVAYT